MPQITRLLVPMDFSPTSDLALQYAIDIARAGASIHVMHVVDDTSLATVYPDGFYVELPGLRALLIDDARKRLADAVQQLAAAHVTVTTEVVVGRPSTAIVQNAKTRGADVIVMGTHGRGGFAHLVLGSVAERVLRAAPCPVLTVRGDSSAGGARAEDAVASRQATRV